MLTGVRPFDRGTPIATALTHINEPPPPLPDDVPQDLRDVIESLLEKLPHDRPANARVVALSLGIEQAELSGLAEGLATSWAAPTPARPPRPRRTTSRRRRSRAPSCSTDVVAHAADARTEPDPDCVGPPTRGLDGGLLSARLRVVGRVRRQPRPKSRSKKPPDSRSALGCPGHRSSRGTPAITWLTCRPQPAQVVLPQVLHVTARHMVVLLLVAVVGDGWMGQTRAGRACAAV